MLVCIVWFNVLFFCFIVYLSWPYQIHSILLWQDSLFSAEIVVKYQPTNLFRGHHVWRDHHRSSSKTFEFIEARCSVRMSLSKHWKPNNNIYYEAVLSQSYDTMYWLQILQENVTRLWGARHHQVHRKNGHGWNYNHALNHWKRLDRCQVAVPYLVVQSL